MASKTPCRLSVSRVSGGGGEDGGYINLTITDESSGIQFVDIEMSFRVFGSIVSGGTFTKVDAELRGLENVGKQFVHEKRTAECPLDTHKREELEAWLLANCQEEGWIINSYLNSQGSVQRVSEKWDAEKYAHRFKHTLLNYQVFKYI